MLGRYSVNVFALTEVEGKRFGFPTLSDSF